MTRHRTIEPLTLVALHYRRDALNHRLRFGPPFAKYFLDRVRAVAVFRGGAVFCYIRWSNGALEEREWSLIVAAAGAPGARLRPVRGVRPGAVPLLAVSGKTAVKRALSLIDDIEAAGFDPADISPFYWRRASLHLQADMAIGAYGNAQHRAHLKTNGFQP